MESLKTVLGVIAIVCFYAIILSFPVQLLWNLCAVPAIDGLNYITFLQAMGLNFLCQILFKNTNTSSKDE